MDRPTIDFNDPEFNAVYTQAVDGLKRVVGTSGELFFKGRKVDGPQPGISIVFQDYGKALLPWRTAAGNVSLAL